MFALAFLIGIYSYLIFILGISGNLEKSWVFISTTLFLIGSFIYFKYKKDDIPKINIKKFKEKKYLLLFLLLVLVNIVGALGPELSFDALWYHLTIPKIFIQEQKIFYIQGGLFYYSLMPKLGEMLFIPGLMFGSEIIPKLIQLIFGIMTSLAVYKISRNFLNEKGSIIASIIFYSSLVVAWESTVAYVDLIRTFYEVMAFWGIIEYLKNREKKFIVESGVLLGLAISTKLIAFGSIPIFLFLFLIIENKSKEKIKSSFIFLSSSLITVFPWLFFSYINSGNPFYPVFGGYDLGNPIQILNLKVFIVDFINLFLFSADPISPIFIIVLPLLVINMKKFDKKKKLIPIYVFVSLLVWYFTPRTGGGRFILPYLPVLSVAVSILIFNQPKKIKNFLISTVLLIAFITLFYRGAANARYIPKIIGLQSENDFLTKNLNFNFGDFYDTDNWFKKNIKEDDKVLLYGFHNIYYVNFPFIDNSYVKKGDKFNFVAVQGGGVPERFKNWKLIYKNTLTNVSVYTLDQVWYY